MSLFQLIGLGFISLIVLVSILAILRLRGRSVGAWFWLILWCSAGGAIADPEATTIIAQAFGVSRGADLVLYGSVLTSFVAFFLVYRTLRAQKHHITILVRQLALLTAERSEPTSPTQESASD